MKKQVSSVVFRIFLSIVALILATMQTSAQDMAVSIRLKNVPVDEVLRSIESQTPYRFSYRNAIIKNKPNVTADFSNVPVKNVLEKILRPLQLDWKMTSGKNISIKKGKPAPQPNQVIFGADVSDDFLEGPLPDAKVEILNADSSKIQDLEIVKYLNGRTERIAATQVFSTLTSGKNYILHGSLEGYHDAWVNVDIPLETKEMVWRKLRLRKIINKVLSEVTVTATKVKMYWKGDTLVYDASAFKLPEGSMLDDLIRQMPGVTMNDDGEIFVNGRKVDELLLGSKSFFRGRQQVLLKNLPYYTVKNIKVYEKSSDLSEILGYEATPKQYVMDVNLLEKYNRGIIAHADGGIGTENRYLGRAFILGYTDILRFSLAANANNINENYHIKESRRWLPEKTDTSEVTTHSVAADLYFDNKKVKNTMNIDFTFTSDKKEMNQRQETFLNGLTPLTTLSANNRERSHRLQIQNELWLVKPWMGFDFNYSHRTFHSVNEGVEERSDSTLISRITYFGHGKGTVSDVRGKISGSVHFKIAKKAILNYGLEAEHNNEKSISMRQYVFDESYSPTLNNVTDYMHRKSKEVLWLDYSIFTNNNLWINLMELATLENSRKRDFLYRPDSLYLPSQKDALLAITDYSNSYNSQSDTKNFYTSIRLRKMGQLPTDESTPIPHDYIKWEVNLNVNPSTQSLHYQRGAIDTLVRSTILTLRPELELNLHPWGTYGRQISLYASHYTEAPSLYDLIDYRDDSTPLIVKLGNPNLKGNQATYAKANFYSRGAHPTLLHVETSFRYFHRSTAQSVMFDPLSGTLTYRPVNVKGNFLGTLAFEITRSFGKSRRWTFSDNTDASLEKSVDHSMLQGETASHINKVKTLMLHDGMYLQFNKGSLNLRVSGDFRWRHSTGRMRDFKTLNVFDFKYGFSAQYVVPILKTAVMADGNVYSRKGYGAQTLNTNRFVMNASISQSFMKGKLVAKLEGCDLLHQLSPSNYEIDAQGRIETSYRPLPRYIMFHLLYQFNVAPIIK